MGLATVIVSRTSDHDLKFRGIEILLDGKFIANLKYGDTFDFEVEPGRHTLMATNRLKSKAIEFEARDGETVEFQTTGIAMGGVWVLISMLGTVAYRVTLEQSPVGV